MGQLQALMGGRAKIIDGGIVPITMMLLVLVINYFTDMQHGRLDGSVEYTSYSYITEHDAGLDASDPRSDLASDDKVPTKLYWKDGNVPWYLQAVQQAEDNSVIIAASVTHAYGINTAAVFIKTKQELLRYTLSNYGVLGYLTVDPTSGVNGTYKVTIFENQERYPPSVFGDFDDRKIEVVSGPTGPQYPLYLMVNTSSYVVMATKNMSKATEFYLGPASFSKQCPP